MKLRKDFNSLLKLKDEYVELTKGIIDYEKFNNFSIVHHGCVIEGSSLTEAETFLLLEKKLTPKNKPLDDTLMVMDHFQALKYVLKLAQQKRLLTVKEIKTISSLILKNTGTVINTMAGSFDSSKGEFRNTTVRAGNRSFMDYRKVPDRIDQLVTSINESLLENDDYIKNNILAFDAHFQMVSIHPFADGNGRLSRLLMNYIQHFHKSPLTVVFEEDKQDYIKALENTRKEENINIFRNFMFSQSEKYFKTEIDKMTQIQKEIKPKGRGMTFLF